MRPVAQTWDARFILKAKRLWDYSFGAGRGEEGLLEQFLCECAEKSRPIDLDLTEGLEWRFDSPSFNVPVVHAKTQRERADFHMSLRKSLAQGLWADAGYPTLTASHTYAAALAATSVVKENAEDIEVPWQAFMVRLPNGLFIDTKSRSVDRILIACHNSPKKCASMTVYRTEAGSSIHVSSKNIADLLFDVRWDVAPANRLWCLLTRVCVGLLYTLQHTNNWKSKYPLVDSKRTYERGPPKHRVVIVGRPLSYDARPSLQQYIHGDRLSHGPPSMQTLVIGHYKRQVIGIGRFGRKVIWIEPYWRGPKNAPILMRPHKIGPPE